MGIFIADIFALFINIYIAIIIVQVGVTWLVAFKVLNTENEQARNLVALLNRLTDPIMKKVQRYVPPLGGIDITPIVVIIGLQILRYFIYQIFV